MNDNQRMEVRNIVKEVVTLIYEWEDEDDNEDKNISDDSARKGLDELPARLKNDSTNIEDASSYKDDNRNLFEHNTVDNSSISKFSEANDIFSSSPSSDDIDADYARAISLTKRRLHLMEVLGFKIITRIDVCSNIVEYAKDIQDRQTLNTFLEKGSALAKILYGPASVEFSKWKYQISKIDNAIE